ncbi:oligosaccharide flippase family protein [Benzoatithermus flavus]|uniref:Oligosaccharide flippase family protein n=1 Tax=Benzoatithermus flavus TaxID=3108223 RepID=A0ABU8XYU3_9PROT
MRATQRLLLLGAARGLASLLGFSGVFLVARRLGSEELGHWSLALAIQGHALHVAEFGLRSVATAAAAAAPEALPDLLRRYLGLRLLLAGLVLATVAVGAFWLRPEAAPLVLLATLAILPIALQLDWLALVDDRPFVAACPLVVRPLGFLLLLLGWPGDGGIFVVAGCYLASWWLAACLSWPALRRPWPAAAAGRPPSPRRLLVRGAPLMLVTLTNQAQLSADLLVAGWSLGASAAGDYWLASQIAVAALLFANAASQLALARLPARGHDPERFVRTLRGEARRLALVATPMALGLGLLGPALLPPLLGTEHAGAANALLWLLPWLLLQHATTLMQAALTALGAERLVLRGNLVLLLTLAPALGAAATAGALPAFALARSAAEIARAAVLLHGLGRRLFAQGLASFA